MVEQPRELRNAFGCFATGVAVATCPGPSNAPIAVTINSFSSVSLVPPLVSFALGQTARCLESFLAASRFSIHVLSADQVSVAKRFARPTGASWRGIGHHVTPSGHIVLNHCAAAFLCERVNVREVGDHSVLIGQVIQFSWNSHAAPLAFCHGSYVDLNRSSCGLLGGEEPYQQLAWG